MDFERIKNKRVIFVGPAPTLENKNLGAFIDGFDFIIRTNTNGYTLPRPFSDYGSRCDIVYFNNQFNRYYWPHNVNELKKNGVKYIRFKSIRQADLQTLKRFIGCGSAQNAWQKIESEGVVKALMLPIVIEDVLSRSPRELHITGVDFYEGRHFGGVDDYHNFYRSEKFAEKLKQDKSLQQPQFSKTVKHDYLSNTLYVKNKLAENKITMQDFTKEKLEKILKFYGV